MNTTEAAKKIVEYFNTEPEWKPGQSASDVPEVAAIIQQAISDAQRSFALDGVHAERKMSVSCPHCNRQVEIVLLVSPCK